MRQFAYSKYLDNTEPPWDTKGVPLIVRLAVRFAITVLGFIVAEWFVNNVIYDENKWFTDGWAPLLLAVAIYVIIRATVRPVLIFLTCPLQLITLGLFILVINALIVLITEWVCDVFSIDFAVNGFWPAFFGALVISVVSFALSRVVRRSPFRKTLR